MARTERKVDQIRDVEIFPLCNPYAEGSCTIRVGNTYLYITATVEEKVPPHVPEGEGWVTAEYSLLPRATGTRTDREAVKGKQGGRTMEIQRLIGRSLRGIVDRKKLGDFTITLDCDVIQADGGTRCASITGAYVALTDAVNGMLKAGLIKENPITTQVAAVSVGISNGVPVLDFDYLEDSSSGTDMNVIMTGEGGFVEIQGTAEGKPFSRDELNALLDLAKKGCDELMAAQRAALAED